VAPFLLYPDPPPAELVRALELNGKKWLACSGKDSIPVVDALEGYEGAIVELGEAPHKALDLCRSLGELDIPIAPILLLVRGNQLDLLSSNDRVFDDFCITPFAPQELDARVRHLTWRTSGLADESFIEYGPLRLDLETYQALVGERLLDLTYMEYELLRYLAASPGKVFTREVLLSQVWGYEYYGGARTVDVHIRRLRAKLGEEHAGLIETVRSVGYRFGQSRWSR
jgi:DNA-binding response OmpR family regulator